MATLRPIRFIFMLFTIAVALADEQPLIQDHEILEPAESNGLVGVASIAGIASRNGRVSSLGGIQIYPGLEAPITITNDGGNYFYPLTVTKEGDGKYASGSIQFMQGYPGSVVVSSSARSGYGPDFKVPFNSNSNKPMHEFFIQPLPDLVEKSRNFDPNQWFLKNVFPFTPPRPDIQNEWFYPTFDPFMNFWR